MKRFAVKLLALVPVLILPSVLFAQTCVNGIDPGCSPDDFCPCPIDSNVYLLIAAAIGIFAFKAYRSRIAAKNNIA